MGEPKARVSKEKKEAVKDIVKKIDEKPIIAVVNMQNLPAKQLQILRRKFRDILKIKMSKKRLIKLALEKSEKKNIEKLKNHLEGMPALIFTEKNPFKLYKKIKKNKSNAPIKPGQKAPKDIKIPEGPTPFSPGPIIGELGDLGIKTGVEQGKVAVQKETVVAEKGEEVDIDLAGILQRLEIKPMEVGLNITAVYEEGNILTREELDIDEEEFLGRIRKASKRSYGLAVEAGIATDSTIKTLIRKAHREAKSIAKNSDVLTEDTIKENIGEAKTEAEVLKSSLPKTDKEEGSKKKEKKEEDGEEKKETDKKNKKEKKEKDKKKKETDSEKENNKKNKKSKKNSKNSD